jgi:hypothetical protein
MHEHPSRLPVPQRACRALILDRWIPPTGKMNHVVGPRECQSYTTRSWRHYHHIELVRARLEPIHAGLSLAAVDVTTDYHWRRSELVPALDHPDALSTELWLNSESASKSVAERTAKRASMWMPSLKYVAAEPGWDAGVVNVTMWLIKSHDPNQHQWVKWSAEWTRLIDQSGPYKLSGQLRIVWLEDMRASEYAGSPHLDLDQLSG